MYMEPKPAPARASSAAACTAVVISDDDDDVGVTTSGGVTPDPWLSILLSDPSAEQSTRRSRSPRRVQTRPRSRSPPSLGVIKRLIETQEPTDDAEHPVENDDSQILQSAEFPEELQVMMRHAKDEARSMSLPIIFQYVKNPDCSNTLAELICGGSYNVDRFYIGATVNPTRRWLGGWTGRNDDDFMPGHCRNWDVMCMIALQRDARNLEKRLIVWACNRWQDRCTNKAKDARGQSGGFNWIYVCF